MLSFNYRHYYDFDKNAYGEFTEEFSAASVASPVNISSNSLKLIAAYYAAKYRTNIHIGYMQDCAKELKRIISEARQYTNDYRKGFCFYHEAYNDIFHTVPMIYIKEGKDEGIIIADSQGQKKIYRVLAAKLHFETGINIFIIENIRQHDVVSCHLDAVLITRDATAKNKNGVTYRLPNLLSRTKERAIKQETYFAALLVDELLKTTQRQFFFSANKEEKSPVVHIKKPKIKEEKEEKEETIEVFRERYSTPDKENLKKIKATYLREKAKKIANIIEIQFYIDQLQKKLGIAWTAEIRNEFVGLTKKHLHTQGSSLKDRPGLFQFTNQFLMKHDLLSTKEKEKPITQPLLHRSRL